MNTVRIVLDYHRSAPAMDPEQAAHWLSRAMRTHHRVKGAKVLAAKR